MEWMWAAMGADVGNPGQPNTTRYNKGYAGSTEAGSANANIGDYAWIGSNSGSTTKPVQGKFPNDLNLYDMTGNVYEWCWDKGGTYSSGSLIDPKDPTNTTDNPITRRRPGGAFSTTGYPQYYKVDITIVPGQDPALSRSSLFLYGLRIVRNVP
jgi:formylglycine-generating enzyme required for sulfatase activity